MWLFMLIYLLVHLFVLLYPVLTCNLVNMLYIKVTTQAWRLRMHIDVLF